MSVSEDILPFKERMALFKKKEQELKDDGNANVPSPRNSPMKPAISRTFPRKSDTEEIKHDNKSPQRFKNLNWENVAEQERKKQVEEAKKYEEAKCETAITENSSTNTTETIVETPIDSPSIKEPELMKENLTINKPNDTTVPTESRAISPRIAALSMKVNLDALGPAGSRNSFMKPIPTTPTTSSETPEDKNSEKEERPDIRQMKHVSVSLFVEIFYLFRLNAICR